MYPIIRLTSEVYIPTYFLIISLGYCLAIFIIYRLCVVKGYSVPIAMDLSLIIMLLGFIGSRLFHVVYEQPDYYLENPMQILYFWQGGFVFYGGAFASFVGAYAYLKYKSESPLVWLDLCSIPITIGYAIGRLATFFSGSGFGTPSSLPWAVKYPHGTEAPAGVFLHPTPLYAVLWESMVALLLWCLLKKGVKEGQGFYFSILLVLHGLGRLIMEQFRGDFRGEVLFSISISSWLSLLLIGLGVFMLTRHRIQEKKC